MSDIWTMLEQDAPKGCEAVQDLYSWSLNFDTGRGPFALFLDIIGWSAENLGEPLYNLSEPLVGYVEAAKLGAALVAYSNRPADVTEYAEALLNAEQDA